MKRFSARPRAVRSAFATVSTLALILLLAAFQGLATAQFEETATVVVVEVPVNVIRDGAPVRGLTPEDFELYDGRKRQKIIGFEVVDLGQVGQEGGESVNEVSISGRRHFLLLFDLSLSDPQSIQRARDAARKLMYETLHPSDLVAVATYSESHGVNLVLNFTPNREQAEVAIRTLGLAQPAVQIQDPLSLLVGEEPQGPDTDSGAQSQADLLLEEMTRDMAVLQGRVRRDQAKNRILSLTSSLTDIAEMMNSVDGRKHVVFLSEGFDDQILTGVEDIERQMAIQREVEFGQVQNVDSTERFGDTQASAGIERMTSAFERAGCAVHTVDIAGVQAGPDADNTTVRNEGLFRMAKNTGGQFYQNYNNLETAMNEVLERTSVTYVLAFQPDDLKLDGKYHKLRVKLAENIPGVELVHRPGYYPPKPFSEQNVVERKLNTAAAVLAGDEGGAFATAALAAPFPSPLAKAYVPVLVEIDGPGLLATNDGDSLVTEIYTYAMDESGAVRDFFARRLGLDVAAARQALEASGFKYYGHLELDPGQYVVRVLVRNAMTGASSLDVIEVSVPDRSAGAPALLPPLFPEPLGKWVFGREGEEEQLEGAPYPFMVGEQPFVPAARPALAPGESDMILMGYDLGEGSLSVSAQLFTPQGQPVDGAGAEIVERQDTAVPGFERLIARFSSGRVPAGDYLLTVTVSDLASGASNTSSAEISISG